jgi:hypothetical protein
MKLVPAPRRRRRRRRLAVIAAAIRSAALLRALVAVVRRRRGLRLALRGSPLGIALAAGALLLGAVRRRRRRRRLEAELGPPNESAPGHRLGPPAAAPAPPADVAGAPNQGATGEQPASEPAERPS